MAPKKKGVAVNLRDLQREMGVGESCLPSYSSGIDVAGDSGNFAGRGRDEGGRKTRWGDVDAEKDDMDLLRRTPEPERDLDWGAARNTGERTLRQGAARREGGAPLRSEEQPEEERAWRKGSGRQEAGGSTGAAVPEEDGDWRKSARPAEDVRKPALTRETAAESANWRTSARDTAQAEEVSTGDWRAAARPAARPVGRRFNTDNEDLRRDAMPSRTDLQSREVLRNRDEVRRKPREEENAWRNGNRQGSQKGVCEKSDLETSAEERTTEEETVESSEKAAESSLESPGECKAEDQLPVSDDQVCKESSEEQKVAETTKPQAEPSATFPPMSSEKKGGGRFVPSALKKKREEEEAMRTKLVEQRAEAEEKKAAQLAKDQATAQRAKLELMERKASEARALAESKAIPDPEAKPETTSASKTDSTEQKGRYVPPSRRNKEPVVATPVPRTQDAPLTAAERLTRNPDTRLTKKKAEQAAELLAREEQQAKEEQIRRKEEEKKKKIDLIREEQLAQLALRQAQYACNSESMASFAAKLGATMSGDVQPPSQDWEASLHETDSEGLAPLIIVLTLLLRECASYSTYDQIQTLVALYAPVLHTLIKKSKVQSCALQCVYDMPTITHAMGNPRVNEEWALLEAFWDALYMSDVIRESDFQQWFGDVDDETPGREEGVFQVLAWFDWLQNAHQEGHDASDQEDFEEEIDYEANIPKRVVAKVERSRITNRGWGALIR